MSIQDNARLTVLTFTIINSLASSIYNFPCDVFYFFSQNCLFLPIILIISPFVSLWSYAPDILIIILLGHGHGATL